MTPKRVALIDGDVLAYRIGYVTETASPAYARMALDSYLNELWGLHTLSSSYQGFLSGSGEHYRHKIAVTQPYKGNRANREKPKHHKILREYMTKEFGFITSEDCEADDLLGHKSQELGAGNCVVISVDKDLLMLPGVHYNLNTHKWLKVSEAEGLAHFYRQVLTGDRIDHIRGRWLPDMAKNLQIGAKRASDHIDKSMTELEMFTKCLELYDGDRVRMMESANLLWIQRKPKGYYRAPDGITIGQLE
jgi:hypothetical protein